MLYWTIKFPENLIGVEIIDLLLNTLYLVSLSSLVLIFFALISRDLISLTSRCQYWGLCLTNHIVLLIRAGWIESDIVSARPAVNKQAILQPSEAVGHKLTMPDTSDGARY